MLNFIKKKSLLIIIAIIIFSTGKLNAYPPEQDPQKIIETLKLECTKIRTEYYLHTEILNNQIVENEQKLAIESDVNILVQLLINQNKLKTEQTKLWQQYENDITKSRYLKGIEIIRILYDKVLSLDHHFSAVRTFSEINKITNPNTYPEFANIKDVLKKTDKKPMLNLNGILGNNIYVSVIQTLTGLFSNGNNSLSKEEKEKELSNIECILDFTLRMNTDLNTIYFETSYLQSTNAQIKEEIERMFKDYSKPIGYIANLEDCRNNDDWDDLKQKLESYLEKLKANGGKAESNKMQINLEFSVDRLLQFIVKYNSFIDDGTRFYQKFKTIINSYENKTQCASKLPIEYKKLADDIDNSIKKFNVAYRSVEINGTKMKELLYGIE